MGLVHGNTIQGNTIPGITTGREEQEIERHHTEQNPDLEGDYGMEDGDEYASEEDGDHEFAIGTI